MRGLNLENFSIELDLVTTEDWTLKFSAEIELCKILVQVELRHFSNQNLENFFFYLNFVSVGW